ncbi:hypothetical protein CBL_20305 [Carabus blaptoides fortunei]
MPSGLLSTDRPAARLGYLPKSSRRRPRNDTVPRLNIQSWTLGDNSKFEDARTVTVFIRPSGGTQEVGPSQTEGPSIILALDQPQQHKRRAWNHCLPSAAKTVHERRVHPSEYRKALEDSLPAPESVLMAQIAQIEAASKAGAPKLKEMEQVTGLTAHMVRYRREKPEYKKFLESAMKERKAKALELFKPKVPPSTLIAIPSTSTARPTWPNIPSTSNGHKEATTPDRVRRPTPDEDCASQGSRAASSSRCHYW